MPPSVQEPGPPCAASTGVRLRVQVLAAPFLTLILLATFAVATGPGRFGIEVPDSLEYSHGRRRLMQGTYVIDWDGVPHVPRYTPGFAVMLIPAIVIGGVEAAPWVPYLFGLALGVTGALTAARIAGPLAAPLTVATVLLARAPSQLSGMLMSDVPTASPGRYAAWLASPSAHRPASGLASRPCCWADGLDTASQRRRAARLGFRTDGAKTSRAWSLAYLAGALPVIAALMVWQGLMLVRR